MLMGTLEDYLEIVDWCFDDIVERGVLGSKSAMAERTALEFVLGVFHDWRQSPLLLDE